MYYGSTPPEASAEEIKEEDQMQIQTTGVVISSTSLLTSSLNHLQGIMEIEPCGLGTSEQ